MRLQHHSTCTSIPGIDGDIQLVRSTSGLLVLDVQGVHRDVAGVMHHDHGTVRLTYQAACDLRDLLADIAEPFDARQAALPVVWGEATTTLPNRRRAA